MDNAQRLAQLQRRNRNMMVFSGILFYTSLKQWAGLAVLEAELAKEVTKKGAEAASTAAPIIESTAEEIL